MASVPVLFLFPSVRKAGKNGRSNVGVSVKSGGVGKGKHV